MAWYRAYFIDSAGKISEAENLEAEDDAGAIGTTRTLFATNDFPVFELWQGSRLVHRQIRLTAN